MVGGFRFAFQVTSVASRADLLDQARAAQDAGFDSVVVPDHVLPGLPAPFPALVAIAEATSLRVGTLVLDNDFRHPALVARDAATLDLLTDGRLDLGIGAGHAEPEYREIGVPFDPAPERVARLEESVVILRGLFDGETVDFDGEHYHVAQHTLSPVRRPALLVGGNGDRVLRLAARYADVVGLTGLGRTLADGQQHAVEWVPAQIDAKVATVREAVAARLPSLPSREPRLQALVQHIEITNDRDTVAAALAARAGTPAGDLLHCPYLLIGRAGEIAEHVASCRERWGFEEFVTRDIAATAAVIDALRRS